MTKHSKKFSTIIFQFISILYFQIVQQFQVEWDGAELNSKSQLINRPDGPLKFNFIKRTEF